MANSIARSEWDFRAVQKGAPGYWPLETWEVPFCYLYEFARHGADADPAIEPEWRKNCTPRTYEALRDKYFKHDPNGKQGYLILDWFYAVWPEWPEGPYQSVSAAERAKRLRGSSGVGVTKLKVAARLDLGGRLRQQI
jgi:hypothetical protein